MSEDTTMMVWWLVFAILVFLIVTVGIIDERTIQADCIKSMVLQNYKPDEISKLCGEIK